MCALTQLDARPRSKLTVGRAVSWPSRITARAWSTDSAAELLAFFARRTFDVEAARDLTAETFAQAFEHRRRFRGLTDAEARGWLYGIARHQLSRYARNGVTERKAVNRLGIQLPRVTEADYERIAELAGLAQLRNRVAADVGELSDDQRAALRLRVIDERPYSEVAHTLGISEPTARARVSRARRTTKGVFRDEGPYIAWFKDPSGNVLSVLQER